MTDVETTSKINVTIDDAAALSKEDHVNVLHKDVPLKGKSFDSVLEEEEEAYYSDSDSFVTIADTDSDDTIENNSSGGGDSDSAIGSESFCVNPFFLN
jgi:hypothetical protein